MAGALDHLLSTLTAFTAGAGQPGMAGRMWQELSPWVQRLVVEAGPKWLPRIGFGFECRVPLMHGGRPVAPCTNNAVAACCACNEPCCLQHAMIDCHGDAICYLCVSRVRDMSRAAPRGVPPAAEPAAFDASEIRAARKILGVKASAGLDEVRQAARKRSGQYHPDNQATGDAEKFRAVREALALLERYYESRSAA